MSGDAWDWGSQGQASTPPPEQTLAWVESELEVNITGVEKLVGGLSSAVHRLTLDAAQWPCLVMRRFTLSGWLGREPHIPRQEAHVLEALRDLDVGVATPELITADVEATYSDVPTILMTEVPGGPDISPSDPLGWANKLAACAARIHQTPSPPGVPIYVRWDDPETPTPTWVTDTTLWNEAKQRVAGPLPKHPTTFIHRDFHPNNIHWQHGNICGVVDWLSACTGPIAAELAHCRWNLAMLADSETSNRFTAHYRKLTGYSEDTTPFDLATVLSAPVGPFPTFAWNDLGRTDLTSDTMGPKIEAWLRYLIE